MTPFKSFRARQLAPLAATAMAAGFVLSGPAAAVTPSASSAHLTAATTSVTATVASGTLLIAGTSGPDQITLRADVNDPNSLVVDTGSQTLSFDRTTFTAISADLRGGDDHFSVDPGTVSDKALTVDGGPGADTIVGSDGNDVLFGGSGADNISGGAGNDVIFAGSGNDFVDGGTGADAAFLQGGNDSFKWDPGDGSDAIDGGVGTDTLVFNGSSGNEQMSLSPNGHRAVFLRDLGNIRMDMDGVERLNLAALGGADSITVNDMAGTDFRHANVDLSVNGIPDGSADLVTVNGSNDPEHVAVRRRRLDRGRRRPDQHPRHRGRAGRSPAGQHPGRQRSGQGRSRGRRPDGHHGRSRHRPALSTSQLRRRRDSEQGSRRRRVASSRATTGHEASLASGRVTEVAPRDRREREPDLGLARTSGQHRRFTPRRTPCVPRPSSPCCSQVRPCWPPAVRAPAT